VAGGEGGSRRRLAEGLEFRESENMFLNLFLGKRTKSSSFLFFGWVSKIFHVSKRLAGFPICWQGANSIIIF